MLSLEAKLARSLEEMTESQRTKFNKAVKEKDLTGNVEPQVLLAKAIITESGGRSIRRNNGAHGSVSEADQKLSHLKEAQVEAYLASGFDEKMARSMAGIDEADPAGEPMTEAQRADAEFCRLIGLSEADALRVAKSNAIRG